MEILKSLSFGPRQSNEVAAYTFLALLDLAANAPWSAASSPLRGITPIIEFIAKAYGVRYAPNTRETIRDVAVYIGDAESKFLHLEAAYLEGLGIVIAPSAKMPDVVVHDTKRNWLLLVEAVTSAGAVDWTRRNELKELFKGCKAGMVFVTAFETPRAMQSFLPKISWETEVWVAEAPDHLIHFDGERFLGPYPDVIPTT